MYLVFNEKKKHYLQLDFRTPAGFDRTRNAVIGNQNFDLTYLEEAYTTEHWLVRIYRVKKPDEFNRPRIPVSERKIRNPGTSGALKKVNLSEYIIKLQNSNLLFLLFYTF